MPGRVVVESALRAGLGGTPRPDADIDGVDTLCLVEKVARQQPSRLVHVDLSLGPGGIEATPTPPIDGFQAEVSQRGAKTGGHRGVTQFKQGIGALAEQEEQLLSEVT